MPYKDPAVARQRQQERRAANREARNAYERQHYAKNKPARRAYLDEWRERNRAQVNAQGRERRKQLDPAVKSRRSRLNLLRSVHGMRPEDWAVLWTQQEGRCYLCGTDLDDCWRTHIDHDHQHCPRGQSCRICRRGIACFDCNVALGHTRDDPERLRRMADALEAAQAAVSQRISEAVSEQLTLI